MSLVSEIRARLEAIDPPAFAMVEGAVALAGVRGRPNTTPAAFVFVREEAGDPNTRATGAVLQRVQSDVVVLIITDNLSDPQGGAAGDDLEALKAKVRQAVVGFEPTSVENALPLEFVSGAVVQFREGCVWHEEVYGTAWHMEEGENDAG